MQNYFDIFDLQLSFDIDKSQLKQSFNTQIIQFHPDKFVDKQQKNQAIQNTSLLNTAFTTLNDDLLRATYILELNNINAFDEKNTNMNGVFLMEMIELQEELETLNSQTKVDTFLSNITIKIAQTTDKLAKTFENNDLENATNIVRELKFYSQTKEKALQKQEF